MLHNDLDDSAPPRCLVHASTVVDVLPIVTRKYLMPVVSHSITVHDSDVALMNDLSDKGLKMVLFTFEDESVTPEEVLEALEPYSHPFNDGLTFPSTTSLSRYLAVQNDVRYVVDRRTPMAFGTRSLFV